MVADEHALLKQRRIWARITELASESIAHVIDLSKAFIIICVVCIFAFVS